MAPEVLDAATGSREGTLALARRSLVSRSLSLVLGLAGGEARWAEVKETDFRGDSRVALLVGSTGVSKRPETFCGRSLCLLGVVGELVVEVGLGAASLILPTPRGDEPRSLV